MDNIVIQVGSTSLCQVEDLVASVCYNNNLAKYHAIVSVPVLATIQSLLQNYPETSLLISCNHSCDGVFFNIAIPNDQKQYGDTSNPISPILPPDVLSLVSCLADGISVSNQSIQLQFFFHGISHSESERRKNILDKFYQPVKVESKHSYKSFQQLNEI